MPRWRIHTSTLCPSSPLLSFGGQPGIAADVPGHMNEVAWLTERNLQWEESTPQQQVSEERQGAYWRSQLLLQTEQGHDDNKHVLHP